MWRLRAVAQADGPPPFPDFTFKREKVPEPGERRAPLVQITPDASAPRAKRAPDEQAEPRLGWFWADVPTGIDADGPARLRAAMTRLANPPAGAAPNAPRLEALQAILRAQGADILRATVGTRVSPALALSVIAVESGGRAEAVSTKGAKGLMQLMPATAARFGVADPTIPTENISGGVAYLDWLIGEFGGDVILALAGYNAGEGALRDHGGVPPFAETRDYVPLVLAAFEVARGLCKTRPELVTDACAFRLASD
ncbi:MAG: lytic transglycosylase domain-containing protein [Roseovarius sp.]|nr:lytic transglycosylase domain-containing protein [Roseovarius sp.]